MGCRWYQAQGIRLPFAFGYRLSYTTFELSGLSISAQMTDGTQPIGVTVTLNNTGKVAGSVVAQVYLGLPRKTGQPPKAVGRFTEVSIAIKGRTTVELLGRAGADPLSSCSSSGR